MVFPPRFTHLVVSVAMSIYMVIIMTFIITVVNTGLDSGFLARWGKAILIAWPIAFALLQLGGPVVRNLAVKLIKSEQGTAE